jgi:hypothetical protein
LKASSRSNESNDLYIDYQLDNDEKKKQKKKQMKTTIICCLMLMPSTMVSFPYEINNVFVATAAIE